MYPSEWRVSTESVSSTDAVPAPVTQASSDRLTTANVLQLCSVKPEILAAVGAFVTTVCDATVRDTAARESEQRAIGDNLRLQLELARAQRPAEDRADAPPPKRPRTAGLSVAGPRECGGRWSASHAAYDHAAAGAAAPPDLAQVFAVVDAWFAERVQRGVRLDARVVRIDDVPVVYVWRSPHRDYFLGTAHERRLWEHVRSVLDDGPAVAAAHAFTTPSGPDAESVGADDASSVSTAPIARPLAPLFLGVRHTANRGIV